MEAAHVYTTDRLPHYQLRQKAQAPSARTPRPLALAAHRATAGHRAPWRFYKRTERKTAATFQKFKIAPLCAGPLMLRSDGDARWLWVLSEVSSVWLRRVMWLWAGPACRRHTRAPHRPPRHPTRNRAHRHVVGAALTASTEHRSVIRSFVIRFSSCFTFRDYNGSRQRCSLLSLSLHFPATIWMFHRIRTLSNRRHAMTLHVDSFIERSRWRERRERYCKLASRLRLRVARALPCHRRRCRPSRAPH